MNLSQESCELWDLLPQQSPDCSRDGQHNLHPQQSNFQPLVLTFGLCLAVKARVSFAMQMLTFPAVIAFGCYCCAVYEFVLGTEGKRWKLSSASWRGSGGKCSCPAARGGEGHTSVPRPLGFSLAWKSKKVAAQSFLCFWLPVGPRVGKVSFLWDPLEGTRVSVEQRCAKGCASFWAELIEEWTFSADFQLCWKFRCSRQLKLKVFTPIKLVKMRKKLKDILWIWKSKF